MSSIFENFNKKIIKEILPNWFYKKYIVNRLKGLGEMSVEETEETLTDPNNRIIKQITVEDVEAFCEEYGITLKVTYVENDGSYEVDTIIDQSRKEGYTVARDTTLTIEVVEESTGEEIDEECNPLEEDCE